MRYFGKFVFDLTSNLVHRWRRQTVCQSPFWCNFSLMFYTTMGLQNNGAASHFLESVEDVDRHVHILVPRHPKAVDFAAL